MGDFSNELQNAYKAHNSYYKKLKRDWKRYKKGKIAKPGGLPKSSVNTRANHKRAINVSKFR